MQSRFPFCRDHGLGFLHIVTELAVMVKFVVITVYGIGKQFSGFSQASSISLLNPDMRGLMLEGSCLVSIV